MLVFVLVLFVKLALLPVFVLGTLGRSVHLMLGLLPASSNQMLFQQVPTPPHAKLHLKGTMALSDSMAMPTVKAFGMSVLLNSHQQHSAMKGWL